MSGTTTELALATAVDSDDNADYLTVNLANSLRTVDALFNNVTGHTHAGAHQGGPVNTVPAAGSITSTMIADGTIATADLANAAVTNAKLASDTARANLLTNGGFEIWQRGNGPFAAQSAYFADRWQIALAGTDTLSASRDIANTDSSAACAVITFTLGTGAGGTAVFQNLIEALPQLRGRTIAFSARVRTATANAVRLAIGNQSGVQVSGAFHSGGGTYQTLNVTYTVLATDTALNLSMTCSASCTAYIDNAMLVVGSQAADYAPLHPADDLARCLRYYEIIGQVAQSFVVGSYGAAGALAQLPVRHMVQKAVLPVITKNGTWSVTNCSQPSVPTAAVDGFFIATTVTALGTFQYFNNSSAQNLVAEANP